MAQSPLGLPGARRCGRTGRDPCGLERDDIAGRDPAVREGPTFHRTKRILAQARPVGADVALWNIAVFVAPRRLKAGPRTAAAFVAHMPGT